MREWRLVYPERPWTLNAERRLHYHARAAKVKEWREAFFWLAKQAGIPSCESIEIVATPFLADYRVQDILGCIPAVKAGIDGITDSGVVPDDNPKYVTAVTVKPPVVKRGYNALEIVVVAE